MRAPQRLKHVSLSLALASVAISGAIGPGPGAAAQCQYDVTIIAGPDCPQLPSPTWVTDVSEAGDVAGFYRPCGQGLEQAFVWTPPAGVITLSFPAGSYAQATGMQSLFQVVGWFAAPNDEGLGSIAFFLDDAPPAALGTLPGGNWSEAHAVRDGVVVGWWGNTVTGIPTAREAFIWQDGVMTSLGPDLGTPKSDAMDINAKGQVTGWMGNLVGFDGNAYVWQDGIVTKLPPIPEGYLSEGNAINNVGDVTGDGQRLDPATGQIEVRGFLWSGGTMAEIAPVAGLEWSAGTDINDAQQVVGRSWVAPGDSNASRGFIWQNGVTRDLDDLVPPDAGVNIKGAWAINNAGQIAATGSYLGAHVGMLLTPCPAPTGDLDGDCLVGIVDFLNLLAAWGACPAEECPGDLDGDGAVGGTDLEILLENWS